MKPLVDESTSPEGPLHQWDDMAVEVEVAELLYSIVRVQKPRLVLETGTGRGLGSIHLAAALRDNGHGRLITYEPLPHLAEQARQRLAGYPAEVRDGNALNYEGDLPDLVFLDSGPDTRPLEIARWVPLTVPLMIHDSHRYSLAGGFTFPTQRGLWIRL